MNNIHHFLTPDKTNGQQLTTSQEIVSTTNAHYGTIITPIVLTTEIIDNSQITYPITARYYTFTGQLIGELTNAENEQQIRIYLDNIARQSGMYNVVLTDTNGEIKTIKIKK